MTLPTQDEIRELTRRGLSGCGLDLDAIAAGASAAGGPAAQPHHGAGAGVGPGGHAGVRCGQDRTGARRVRGVEIRSGTGARAGRPAVGPAARGAQGGPRRAGDRRGGEDSVRGRRRGAGDDRHLRTGSRTVTAAVRQDPAQRTTGPPPHGDVASAGRRGRHLRVQLPGRPVCVEHRARDRVRRSGRVEAVGARAAVGPGCERAAHAGLPGVRAVDGRQPCARGRSQRR